MKEWQKRVLRTFVQVALGSICSAIVAVNWNADSKELKAVLIGILTTGIASGVAAAMNIYDDKNNY